MKEEDRKQRFITLLNKLLDESGGIQKKLAVTLGIKSSTLSNWLLGKVDPASLDLQVFRDVAKASLLSTNELAELVGVVDRSEDLILERFKQLLQDLLSSQSQKELSKKLGISNTTVNNWLSSQINVDPQRIAIGTISKLANEKGLTIEGLLFYLGLLAEDKINEDILTEIQAKAAQLPFLTQITLTIWFLDELKNKLYNWDIEKSNSINKINFRDRKICVILSQDNLSNQEASLRFAQRAGNYSSNLAINYKIKPKNIKIATTSKIPELLEDFDSLIFDIETNSASAIELINQISFNSNIVIFTSQELEEEVRSQLKDKVTDIVVKPIDWESMKDKPYFAQI